MKEEVQEEDQEGQEGDQVGVDYDGDPQYDSDVETKEY
jgi:hypothetical protein